MDIQATTFALYAAGAAALATSAVKLKTRLELSKAKHKSLTGHARMSRMLASFVPYYEYEGARFFRSDDPPADVAAKREAGFARLADLYKSRFAETTRATREAAEHIPDLEFTSLYRVPFQYARHVRDTLASGAFVQAADGVMVTDLDGNRAYDVTGSYGCNLFGYDFYKACIARAEERMRPLGPVLGPYHPVVADNVRRLREISGHDDVSFHMSGTEAVMQAVRLARYHTKRTHLVRFCGAYHGWWGDVQPGVGNPIPARETYTLDDMSEDALRVLRRRRDIACVLINPYQSMKVNAADPVNSALVDSARRAHFDREAYAAWLKELRAVCTERGIILIFDEIFLGFRLGIRGAQEYFGVKADLVTYGKTLGGGLPVGVVCGTSEFMKRYRDDRPGDICFARGTFNSHPYVMATMNEFLVRLNSAEVKAMYRGAEDMWNGRAQRLNARLSQAGVPVEIASMGSVWSVLYTKPARYNWMFQYYLRAEGLALSWIGTGRLIFSLNYTEADFDAVAERFVTAAEAMQTDGWWWSDPTTTNKSIKRTILREIFEHRFLRKSA